MKIKKVWVKTDGIISVDGEKVYANIYNSSILAYDIFRELRI